MIYIDVDTAVTVPANIMPLMDDTDFITREVAVAYNEAGMDLVWNFVTSAGVITQTAVTPTTAGVYDWTHVGDAMYKIEIPASAGGTINNDAEGVGYFTGICTGVLAWRGPDVVFRAAALNDAMIDGGDSLDVNVTAVSGDTTAADNAEAFFDGTGYAGTNNTIPTVTTNSDMRGTDSAATAASLATAQTDLDIVTGTTGALLDVTADVYHANIQYVFDSPVDEYTVTWFKNGNRITSGITVPTVQVAKRTDGTDLVPAAAMTQIGTTGSYRYDEATNVIVTDEGYVAVVAATIDAGGRTYSCLVSRSS